MASDKTPISVYVETGKSRTFATALAWPGWSRSGRVEAAALQTLYDYAPRYARVLESTALDFRPPSDLSALEVTLRLAGNATTDFGAPNLPLPDDTQPIDPS